VTNLSGSTTSDAKILCMMNYGVKLLLEGILNIIEIRNWVNPSLGGTTKNHLKEWLRDQKWSNHFLGPNLLNIFISISFFSYAYSLHALIYGLKFILKFLKMIFFLNFIFLIKIVLSKICSFNFGNSQLNYTYAINCLIKV
jgi:hypothetical protein